ncbi:hypothetical protein AX17_000544 [Amanita inopinata Kibby_2008]|nr:hypothetical protein AX17_000544 [Amanita inopinata Kibby_2008]
MARARWRFGISQHQHPQASTKPATPVIYSADAKKFGLENFGNTCYANSVIQSLYFCAPFRDLMLQAADRSISQGHPIPPSPGLTNPSSSAPSPITPSHRKPERKPSVSGYSTDHADAGAYAIPSSPSTLFSALRSLFLYISCHPSEKGTVAPRAFIEKLKEVNELFRSNMHQDAHEFLNYLLNKIVEEVEEERKHNRQNGTASDDLSNSIVTLSSSKAPPTVATTRTASSNSGTSPQDATLVHRLFEGVLTSETRCLTCETVSSRDESFLDLSIDIEKNSSVTACLRQFSASEMLSQRNKFFCDACCGLQEAEKRMKIKKLPNVLALHLKRFKYQEDVQKYIKLAYRVAFPFELRLFNTVDDGEDADRMYNLFAIVVHIGNGPYHGHYISIIKTLGTWLVFDDDNVYPIPEHDISKYFGDSNAGSAYVLYYQAADIDSNTLGLRTRSSVEETKGASAFVNATLTRPDLLMQQEPQPIPSKPPGLSSNVESAISLEPSFPDTSSIRPGLAAEKKANESDANSPALPNALKSLDPHADSSSPPLGRAKSANVSKPTVSDIPTGLRRSPSTSRPHTQNHDIHGKPGSQLLANGGMDTTKRSPLSPKRPSTSAASFSRTHDKERDKPQKEPDTKPGNWFRRKSFKIGDRGRPLSAASSTLPPSPGLRRGDERLSLISTTSVQKATPLPDRVDEARHKVPDIIADGLHRTPFNGSGRPHTSSAMLSVEDYGHNRHYTLSHRREQQSSHHIVDRHESGRSISSYGSIDSSNPTMSHSTSSSPVSTAFPSSNPTHLSPLSSNRIPVPSRGTLEYSNPIPDSQSDRRDGRSRPLPLVPSSSTASSNANTATVHHGASLNNAATPPKVNGAVYVTEPEKVPQSAATIVSSTSSHIKKKSASYSAYTPGFGVPLLGSDAKEGLSSASNQLKRATRKLSFTAPMLGFGRKDKDKHREKQREKMPLLASVSKP